MTVFEIASLVIAFANATAAIVAAVGIWHGIRAMVRVNDERGRQQGEALRQQGEALKQQREADDQRHAEAMTKADQRHEETMTALRHQAAALDELIRAGQRQTAALDELLRRPASAPGAG